jgi:hypothetical protein
MEVGCDRGATVDKIFQALVPGLSAANRDWSPHHTIECFNSNSSITPRKINRIGIIEGVVVEAPTPTYGPELPRSMRAPGFAGVCDASVPAPVEMSSRRDLAFCLPGRGRILRDKRYAEHQCRSSNAETLQHNDLILLHRKLLQVTRSQSYDSD